MDNTDGKSKFSWFLGRWASQIMKENSTKDYFKEI